MKRGIKIALWIFVGVPAIFIIGFVVLGIVLPDDETTGESVVIEESAANEMTEEEKLEERRARSPWGYSEERDKMDDGEVNYTATIVSTSKIEMQGVPGGAWGKFQVKNIDGKNRVFLALHGANIANEYAGEYVRIKFGDKSAKKYDYTLILTNNELTSQVEILDAKKIIKKIKKYDDMKIEFPVYQGERELLEFNIFGFEWDH